MSAWEIKASFSEFEYDIFDIKEAILDNDNLEYLREALTRCKRPSDLIKEWDILKEYLASCDAKEKKKVKVDFLLEDTEGIRYDFPAYSANKKLAYYLATSDSALEKTLSPNSNEKLISIEQIKKLEFLLGCRENELLYGRCQKSHTYEKFVRLDKLTRYRLASEVEVYKQIPLMYIVQYYSLPKVFMEMINYLLEKLNQERGIYDECKDSYQNQLSEIINESPELIKRQCERYTEQFEKDWYTAEKKMWEKQREKDESIRKMQENNIKKRGRRVKDEAPLEYKQQERKCRAAMIQELFVLCEDVISIKDECYINWCKDKNKMGYKLAMAMEHKPLEYEVYITDIYILIEKTLKTGARLQRKEERENSKKIKLD